jgi:hypothetical protein
MKRLLGLIVMTWCCITFGQSHSSESYKIAKQEVSIKLFPNPATSVINILGLKNSSKANIMVSDSYGTTVLRHEWEIQNQALNIPVAHLEKGIYLVTIISPEQHIQTKFYKQ